MGVAYGIWVHRRGRAGRGAQSALAHLVEPLPAPIGHFALEVVDYGFEIVQSKHVLLGLHLRASRVSSNPTAQG